MKKLILTIVLLTGALAVTEARADPLATCTLTVLGGGAAQIGVHQYFTYEINIVPNSSPYPLPSPLPSSLQYTIRFFGTGITAPEGEIYPSTFGSGYSVLEGYWNPGGVSGTYVRSAMIYVSGYGDPFACSTNAVWVYLL